ncbi:aldo/keto reductase [Phycisphaeraceae bacterium D3-23]
MPDYHADDKRYDDRHDDWFRRCGMSGLWLPAISLGCWHNFGGAGRDSGRHADEADMHANCKQMLHTAFDHGVTHFDLANNYGPPPGSAETRVGQILHDDFRGYRDELIVSSKAGWDMWPGPYGNFGSRKHILASLDQSLARLQLDYVDVFYSHRPDPTDTPLEETLGALDTAVRSGKALYCGISMYPGQRTEDVLRVCADNGLVRPIIHQPNYSMLDRWIERDLLGVTDTAGLGVITFSPLAQGLLTDKYLEKVPTNSRAGHADGFLDKGRITPKLQAQLKNLATIAQKRGQTLAQMALSWTLRDKRVTSTLIGASSPEQILENLKAAEQTHFDKQELAAIDVSLAM